MLIEDLLPENLVYTIKEQFVDPCKVCEGSGRTISRSPEGVVFARCTECIPKFNFQIKCAVSNIPRRFWGAKFSDLGSEFRNENGGELEKIEKFVASLSENLHKGTGLLLQGHHGVAKTFLGSIILQIALPNYRCYFSLLSDLVTLSFESRNNDSKKELLNDIISNTDLLMIDEVDKVAISVGGQVVELVDSLFRKRYFENRSVILTGNCLMEDIEKAFGSSVSSMLTETTIPIILTGEDFRKNLGGQLTV